MFKLCVYLCVLLTPLYAVAEVGTLAAVNRDVEGTRPAESPRALVLSERLIQNERVKTSDAGGGQIMFLDQTTLTLTPNSDIILDKYVFDPEADTGALSVTMLTGAMRLVGGPTSRPSRRTTTKFLSMLRCHRQR